MRSVIASVMRLVIPTLAMLVSESQYIGLLKAGCFGRTMRYGGVDYGFF